MHCKKKKKIFLPFSVSTYLAIMKYIEQGNLKNNQKNQILKFLIVMKEGKLIGSDSRLTDYTNE